MNISAANPGYNYRPENPPPKENWSEHQAYQDAEAIHEKATQSLDFFRQADNSTAEGLYDLDPREGFVQLREVDAPGLLERHTAQVSGVLTPEGDLFVSGRETSFGETSTLTITEDGKEVTMGRPVYVNDRYLPTVENLTYEDDGSRTYQFQYTPWT